MSVHGAILATNIIRCVIFISRCGYQTEHCRVSPQYLPSSQGAHLPTSLPVSHKLQGPPPSAEFMTLEHCTVPLETALSDLERDLVHFLCLNDFISDDVRDKVLNPVSVLSKGEKAGEVVRWIKKKVMRDPGSYHVLMRKLQQGGRRYQPIINKLEATRQQVARGQSVIYFGVRYIHTFMFGVRYVL